MNRIHELRKHLEEMAKLYPTYALVSLNDIKDYLTGDTDHLPLPIESVEDYTV